MMCSDEFAERAVELRVRSVVPGDEIAEKVYAPAADTTVSTTANGASVMETRYGPGNTSNLYGPAIVRVLAA